MNIVAIAAALRALADAIEEPTPRAKVVRIRPRREVPAVAVDDLAQARADQILRAKGLL